MDVTAVNIIFYCFLIVIVRILCFVYYHFMFMSIFLSVIQSFPLGTINPFWQGTAESLECPECYVGLCTSACFKLKVDLC